ncbi:MAG: hypothetical protein V4805_17270 [Pseudomonadota bacterium]
MTGALKRELSGKAGAFGNIRAAAAKICGGGNAYTVGSAFTPTVFGKLELKYTHASIKKDALITCGNGMVLPDTPS